MFTISFHSTRASQAINRQLSSLTDFNIQQAIWLSQVTTDGKVLQIFEVLRLIEPSGAAKTSIISEDEDTQNKLTKYVRFLMIEYFGLFARFC